MGFPGGTVDLPGEPRPELAGVIAAAQFDPYGHGERLVKALRERLPVAFGHLATNAWVFDPDAARVLLVRHRTLGWVSPGGHLDDGESPANGAARELAEESGLVLTPAGPFPVFVRANVFPARDGDSAHWHWNIHYRFVGDPQAPLVPEPGAPLAWWPVDDLPTPAVGDLAETLTVLGREKAY